MNHLIRNYVLDERHNPVPEPDLMAWVRWFEDFSKRRVDRTELGDKVPSAQVEGDDVSVSTLFLGVDHNWFGDGPPLLFETMIFGGEYGYSQWRWSTWQEAADAHRSIVGRLRRGENPTESARSPSQDHEL